MHPARLFRTPCYSLCQELFIKTYQLLSSAHSDAIWGISWTQNDTAISISADGSVKQWSAASGQPHPPNATFPTPHTLAQVSLSVSLDGKKALYNSIEGHTSLWNLENGEIVASFESYVRTVPYSEACTFQIILVYTTTRFFHSTFVFLAWSVSLNPRGETYASTGTSKNVFIHSAQTSNFGERLSTLSSGRNKFGMFCAHVCFKLILQFLFLMWPQQSPDG